MRSRDARTGLRHCLAFDENLHDDIVCVSITIKLNEVFKMSCDSGCEIFWVTARGGVCIRDDLLAFDRQARVRVRPN